VSFQGVKWFWGLTCDFWAEFEEIIFGDGREVQKRRQSKKAKAEKQILRFGEG
jgi:hypothetical protein